jgi:hypothetical protein
MNSTLKRCPLNYKAGSVPGTQHIANHLLLQLKSVFIVMGVSNVLALCWCKMYK